MTEKQADFDWIARPYRALEYLTLGRMLERTREHFLPQLKACRNALVLGDGDGRFLAKLLRANPQLHATAVDTSATMLALLSKRCNPYSNRFRILQADARQALPKADEPYDLVAAHFFLDCLTQDELLDLVQRAKPLLAPRALYVVSDLRVPEGRLRLPAWLYVRGLYLCFRILTGLRTTRLPDHTTAMSDAGFVCVDRQLLLAGMLITEVWQNGADGAP
ncbi:MAG: class I SAM-dependent methyltransferase [Acidobacteria bacterium]|nr:class I SAM-dependent methyltransferase [Acidobacteriota bacterium]